MDENGKEDIVGIDSLETKRKITTDLETSSKNICDESSGNIEEESTHVLKSDPKVASIKEDVNATIKYTSENNINMDDSSSNKVSNHDKILVINDEIEEANDDNILQDRYVALLQKTEGEKFFFEIFVSRMNYV